MRWLRTYGSLIRADLTRGPLWWFLLAVALVGPCFVVFHVVTDRTTWEPKPILSEPASIEHFDTSMSLLSYLNGEAVGLFQSPQVESSTDLPFPRAFLIGWALVPASNRLDVGTSTWSLPNVGSALDFYRLIFPILMAIAGVLALPSRRRLSLLRTVVPSGRWGCFLLFSGRLLLEVALLGAITAVLLGAAMSLIGQPASGAWLFGLRYGALLTVYGAGFALFGLTVAQVVRRRSIALLVAAALLIGVAPFVSIGQSHLQDALVDAFPAIVSSQPSESPPAVSWITSSVLVPPQDTLYQLAQRTWIEVPESWQAGIARFAMPSLASLWVRLIWFVAFWWLIGWAVTPRRVERGEG